jgi:hypothetical protein
LFADIVSPARCHTDDDAGREVFVVFLYPQGMVERWRDGEEMERRWRGDGEEMERRWRGDGEEMERWRDGD